LLTARPQRFQIPEAQHQFGGFGGVIGGGVGISIPAFGSGGGFAGVPGFAAAAGAINPFATLESAFGTGVTAQSIADAIRVAEQEGRFTGEGPSTGAITIATGAVVRLVLNVVRGLFEIIDQGGKVVGVGVTPEAALESLNAGGGILAGGGGGTEPLPFPRRSPPSRPLPLSHLRRSPRPSAKTSSARSRHSSPSCNPDSGASLLLSQHWEDRRRSPQSRFYPADRSTSPSSSGRPAIPREYVDRVFPTRNSSTELDRSVKSSALSSASEKRGRTRTSNGELSNSS